MYVGAIWIIVALNGVTISFKVLLAGMSQLSFILIGGERNDLRDPTSSWAAARS